MASAYLELTTASPKNPQYTAVQSLELDNEEELSELHILVSDVQLFQPLQLSTLKLSESATVHFDVNADHVPKVQTACILSGLQVFAEGTNGTDRRILKASKGPSLVKSRALVNNIIDEDDLLQDEGEWAPDTTAKSKNLDDCGGREPCDNCTCGRGDAAANQNTSAKTSNCGKCGMGDAFRCASCPFLGKPAFKPGQEHLVLDLQDDL